MAKNVSGPFEVHTNVTLGSGTVVFRDKSINPSTSAVIDFSDSYGGGSKSSYSDGDTIKNMCYLDDFATTVIKTDLTATGASGGVVFNYSGNGNKSTISLPPSARIKAASTRFFVSTWFKINSGATNPANNNYNLIYIGSGLGNDTGPSAVFRWGDARAKGTEITAVPTTILVYGKVITLPSSASAAIAAIKQGQVFNLAFDVNFDETGANKNTYYVDIYLNGSLIGSTGPSTADSRSDATSAYALSAPETSSPLAGVVFYRFRLDDLTESQLTGANIAATEYNSNRGYFS